MNEKHLKCYLRLSSVFVSRLLLSDSFVSQTKRHYQPHIRADCSGSSTNIVNKPTPSGFHQLRIQPKPAPVEEKVRSV